MNAALKPLHDARWLEELPPSATEVSGLLGVLDRTLEEVQGPLKYPDTRFDLAYRAVLTAATVVVRAEGARVSRQRHHEFTFRALELMRIAGLSDRARYYDACRRKRNVAEYEMTGQVSESEAAELVAEAERLGAAVRDWLRREHPHLIEGKPR